jgi:hypothetical protein
MDCKNARLLLDFLHPAEELDAAATADLKQHLHSCPDCQELSQAERRLDDALGQAMRAVDVPDGLRMRLLGRLQTERDRWYWRQIRRWGAVAAAAVLVIAGLSWYALQPRPASLDLGEAKRTAEQRLDNSQERVTEWLRSVGGHDLVAPPNFRYDGLEYYAMTRFRGHDVPTLFFHDAKKENFARVYVLSAQQFDLEAIDREDAAAASYLRSGQVKVRVLPNPPNPRVRYLVIFSGDKVEHFLQQNLGPLA